MEFDIEKYHLKSTSFFEFLSEEETELVKSKIIRKEYMKNEFLFKEQSYSKGVFIIRKGKVKLFQTSSDGKQSIVYIYKTRDFFGYRPLLANEPHPVSAVAMDNTVVSFISQELFMSIVNRSSSFAKKLLVNLSKEFSVWINKTTIFSQYAVKERVALSLLILSRVYKRNDEDTRSVAITINRDDFAGFVGTAKETLVRTLRMFKDEKIITSKGTKIIILKPRVLLNIISDI